LNLLGIVTPGERLAALAGNRLLLRDGVPVAVQASGEVKFLVKLSLPEEWSAKNALLRRPHAAATGASGGRSADRPA
jgi:ATP-dependent Lhr-like helicase